MTDLLMSGHDRTFVPPRSLRHKAREEQGELASRIATGRCDALDLMAMGDTPWAVQTLESLVSSIDSEISETLGCNNCEDTGFYGIPSSGNEDLLVGLVKRAGEAEFEILGEAGIWEPFPGAMETEIELLSLETAEDLASALVSGGSGLLRKYCQPMAFIPPAKVVTASLLADLIGLEDADTPRGEWVNFALVDDDDVGAIMQVVRADAEGQFWEYQDGEWEPWEAEDGNLLAIELDDETLNEILTASGALLAYTSPDPRAEKLRRYWSTGRGGAKIRWNTPSDWRRCYRHLKKYLGLRAKGYCQLLHRRNTGMWTGDKRNRGLLSSGPVESPVRLPSGGVLRLGDSFQVLGPKAVPYSAQMIDSQTLWDRTDPQLVRQAMNVLNAGGNGHGENAVAVLLQSPCPEPVATEMPGPGITDLSEVKQSLLSSSPMRPEDPSFRISMILTPSVEEVLGAHVSLPDVITAAVNVALRDYSGWAHGTAAQGIAVILPPSVMSLAKSSGDNGTARAILDHTARHGIHNTLDVPVEEQLLTSLQSGSWSGESERNSDMPESTLKDGIYGEVEDSDAGVFRTLIAGGFPVAPPKQWFEDPKLTGPTPMEIGDDGRVYGHIATWDATHIGMGGSVKPPKSASNYAYYRTGILATAEGEKVNVGQITLAGGHAPMHASAAEAVKHYDDTNSAVADVASGEDIYGIWVAGSLRPDVTASQIRAFRASPPSGDWRMINGNLELVAACSVNVPGFMNVRTQALAAGGAILSLVAAGSRPLAERRLSLLADAAVLDRITQLEERIAAIPVVVTEPEPVLETPEPVVVTEPEPVVQVEEPVVAEAVAATAVVAEPPIVEENVADATAAAVEEHPDEVQPEVADKLDPDQIAQAKADAKAIRRDWLRREAHGGWDDKGVTAGNLPPQFAKKSGSGDKKISETERKGGGYPIKDAASLKDAIQAVGRAKPGDRARTIAHIKAAASKLGLTKMLPSTPGW